MTSEREPTPWINPENVYLKNNLFCSVFEMLYKTFIGSNVLSHFLSVADFWLRSYGTLGRGWSDGNIIVFFFFVCHGYTYPLKLVLVYWLEHY